MNKFVGYKGAKTPPILRILHSTRYLPKSGCMVLDKKKTTRGYLQVRVNGVLKVAARVVWEYFAGAIPAGRVVTWNCGRRTCVRMGHLRLATRSEVRRETVARMKRRR